MRAIIITGDRNAKLRDWDHAVIEVLMRPDPTDFVTVIHGACGVDADETFDWRGLRGIDYIAHVNGMDHPRISVVAMPAPFKRKGLRGGPMRNTAMLKVLQQLAFVGYPIEVHAFHDDLDHSKGTKDMVKQARAAGVATFLHRSNGSVEQLP